MEINKRLKPPKYNPPPMPETASCAPEIKYVVSKESKLEKK